MRDRQQSYFYNLRRFHNWIKRKLIDKYAYGSEYLLDLASGKGGDISKWIDAKIKHVKGFDIHEPSVIEARRRLADYNTKNNIDVTFNVADLSSIVLPKLNGRGTHNEMDIVTSMFAFHYFFKSPETLDTVLQSIENNLKMNGVFICCMFDGNAIFDKLGTRNTYETPFFKMKLKVISQDTFGNKLGVTMKETVLDNEADEYIVNSTEFINLMKWRGFELVETKMFAELYDEWTQSIYKVHLKNLEKDVSFMNRYYVFQKVFDINPVIRCFHQMKK
jgi:mRNA (guanine-N7-)-methyltransferase